MVFLGHSELSNYQTWWERELTSFINPTMHLSYIPQCTIQNRNVHISVFNGALWDMEQMHSEFWEIGLLKYCFIMAGCA